MEIWQNFRGIFVTLPVKGNFPLVRFSKNGKFIFDQNFMCFKKCGKP